MEQEKSEVKLINSNLLQEERYGQMFRVKVGPEFEKIRKNFSTSLSKWEFIIDKTTDLFVRITTDQAEIVATVLFTADILNKNQNDSPSEVQVLDSVMQWKQKRRPPLDKTDVASTIRNLGMLHWLKVKPDECLPVRDEEAVLV